MSRQTIMITDKTGQIHIIPDAFIMAKMHGEYKDMPPFKAFGRAIEDWIAHFKVEVTHG